MHVAPCSVQTERPSLPTAALKLRGGIPRTCPPPSSVQVAVTVTLHCGASRLLAQSLRLASPAELFVAILVLAGTLCVIPQLDAVVVSAGLTTAAPCLVRYHLRLGARMFAILHRN